MGKLEVVKGSTIIEDMKIGVINIEISDEIAGVLMTLFTCLHKEENDPVWHQKYKGFTAKIDRVDISIQSLVEDVNKAGIRLNCLVATPIVDIMTLFKAFFNEVSIKSTKRDATGRAITWDPGVREMT